MAGGNARIVNSPNQAVANATVAHEALTVSSTALNLSSSISAGSLDSKTTHVLVQVEGANIRVTFDGATSPTANLGFQYVAGSSAYWSRNMFQMAKAIREGGADATLQIQELIYV